MKRCSICSLFTNQYRKISYDNKWGISYKNVDIKFGVHDANSQNIKINSKISGSKKTKESKQNTKIRVRPNLMDINKMKKNNT